MKYFWTVLLLILVAGCNRTFNRDDIAPTLSNSVGDQDLPYKSLNNGFRYIVDPVDGASAVEIRLIIFSGSLTEPDGKEGMAHLVEHMAFNGTTLYPKNTIVDFFQDNGMRFGGDLNAATTLDRVIYRMSLPDDDPEVMREALKIVEQWLTGVSFNKEDVDAEKPIIIAEKRLREENEKLALAPRFPFESSYRELLGTEQSINALRVDDLKTYYRRYYRPDNAALVVTGAVDVGAINKLVIDTFGAVEKLLTPPPKRIDLADAVDQPLKHIFIEKKLAGNFISVDHSSTAAAVSDIAKDNAIGVLLEERLAEIFSEKEPKVKVEVTSQYHHAGVKTTHINVSNARSIEPLTFFDILGQEAAKLKTENVTNDELEFVNQLLRSLRISKVANRNPVSVAEDWLFYFLHNDGVPVELLDTGDITPEDIKNFYQQIVYRDLVYFAREQNDYSNIKLLLITDKPAATGSYTWVNRYKITAEIMNGSLQQFSSTPFAGGYVHTLKNSLKIYYRPFEDNGRLTLEMVSPDVVGWLNEAEIVGVQHWIGQALSSPYFGLSWPQFSRWIVLHRWDWKIGIDEGQLYWHLSLPKEDVDLGLRLLRESVFDFPVNRRSMPSLVFAKMLAAKQASTASHYVTNNFHAQMLGYRINYMDSAKLLSQLSDSSESSRPTAPSQWLFNNESKIIVTGNIDSDEILARLDHAIGGQDLTIRENIPKPESRFAMEDKSFVGKGKRSAEIYLTHVAQLLSATNKPSDVVLSVVNNLLHKKLERALREKLSLTYTLGTDIDVSFDDKSVYFFMKFDTEKGGAQVAAELARAEFNSACSVDDDDGEIRRASERVNTSIQSRHQRHIDFVYQVLNKTNETKMDKLSVLQPAMVRETMAWFCSTGVTHVVSQDYDI